MKAIKISKKKAIKISKTKAKWIVKNATKIQIDEYGIKTYYLPFLPGTALKDVLLQSDGLLGSKGDGTLSFDIEIKENAVDILDF